MRLRAAGEHDGDAIAAIYAPMVATTAISFEADPPSGREMGARVVETVAEYPWLVMEADDGLAGYAYAHRFAPRAAYAWSVETSVYVDPAHHRRGVGRALYAALLTILRAQGYRVAIALVALPNPGSVGLHETMGFRSVGVYEGVGWKLGAWHDVGMWQLDLQPEGEAPTTPTPLPRLPPDVLAAAFAQAATT